MSELDDAKEFSEVVESLSEILNSPSQPSHTGKMPQSQDAPSLNPKEYRIVPGQPTQYALYGPGYTATTPTVDTLPAGCYDIEADNKCCYAVPSLKPSGLLLELPEMRSEDIIKMVERFWNSEKDYKEGNEFVVGGAAFKAGVMIYGPPGSGKSKTIQLVSSKLVERGGTVFFASCNPHTAMAFLSDFCRVEPNRKSIVILEDIDSLIEHHGESTYLEMLDSAKTIDNVLFIATTNYPERLDPRIYCRPGRFSHVMKIGYPSAKAREAYLKAILKNHKDVEEIVKSTDKFTVDHLTALVNSVYREGKNLENEIERLRTLFKPPKSESKPFGIGIE